ncbi:MAG: FAD-dependent oxidoreductase [Balneolaceae bacterium]|nr:FAD-dependent oxidoreductase [Balneolaceae bacterium]
MDTTHFKINFSLSSLYLPRLITTLLVVSYFVLSCFNYEVVAQNNSNTSNTSYDVLIIGGTPAGVAAAIAAGRAGKNVMLVEQAPVLGGVLSSGVNRLDDYVKEANSGVMEEFRQRVAEYHLTELAEDPVVKNHIENLQNRKNFEERSRWSTAEGRAWEPYTAARIYGEMVAEVPSITTRFEEVPVDAILEDDRIVGVVTRKRNNYSGELGEKYSYRGKVIIDATYEGDVAAYAEVPYRIGREARSREEPHAGQIYTDAFCGERASSALRGTIFPGSTGKGDKRMQAFTFRFVAKDYGRANHPYRLESPPPGYDASRYSWNPGIEPHLPNSKRDMLGATNGGDLAGLSSRYIEADWEERAEIEEIYRKHELGWLYYIQTEGNSPQWGLAENEFTDNNNWPYRLYVRQGRRIEGEYKLTESDLHKYLKGNGLRGPLHKESIAIGIYPMDVHNVQNPQDVNAPCGEGAIHLNDVTGPYQIPYGVMVPQERKGLLVPIGISSTHVAMSSVRMEPVWSSLGQASGVAAALAVDSNIDVSEVPVPEIQEQLLQQGSMLFFYKDVSGDAEEFDAVQKMSLQGAIDGDENYYFRPDQPITKAEFAKLVIEGLDVPLSITGEHFKDVTRSHPHFEYIETLYDYSTQSNDPFFNYKIWNTLNYWWGSSSYQGPPVYAYPDKAITGSIAKRIVSGILDVFFTNYSYQKHLIKEISMKEASDLLENNKIISSYSEQILSRGDASRLINELREDMGF